MAKLPIYKVVLSDDDEGMDFNAFVDYPAHSKAFHLFDGQKPLKQLFSDDEKRIVTGVAIATNLPIYRREEGYGEYYLYFDADTVKAMAQRMFEKGYMHRVNEMHESNKQVKGVTLIESYFIDYKRGVTPPNAFKDQNLQDGTWIVSYKVDDERTWQKLKSGVFQGFSIEAWFSLEKANFKNQNRTQMKKSVWENLKAAFSAVVEAEETPSTFGEATTTDGNAIKWEGELTEGTVVYLVGEEEILAPEGVHAVLNEDGSTTVITLDANAVVTAIETVSAEEEVAIEEVVEDMANTIGEMKKQFAAMAAKVKTLEAENVELKKHFDKTPSKPKTEKQPTWKNFSK
jgi:hypothetical protein